MNLNNLIGKTPEEAELELDKAGHELRVTAKDGEPFAVTMDYREKRVNVSVSQGKIVSVQVG